MRTRSSDPSRGPSSSPNDPWHLPSARTVPSNNARGPSGSQMVTGTSLSDPMRDPRGSPNGPWHLPSTCTGPSNHALGHSSSPNCP
ncbi:UNVERIFIED_CONTAM: hypothetical protein FKN15_057153 [Acipenser sinensis]